MFDPFGIVDALVTAIRDSLQNIVNAIVGGLTLMIDAIFSTLLGAVDGLVAGLPDVPPLDLSSVSGVMIGYSWLDSFTPITETLGFLGVYISVASTIFLFKSVDWLIEKIPFE